MDVERQTNLPEERMSDCRSFSSNYRVCSQSRKISIGVLVDSIAKPETNGFKEAVTQTAEVGTPSKGDCVKDRGGHSPRVEKHVTVSQKNTSPWVSTRSFNPNQSSSVAVHDAERTPSFPATRKTHPRSKLSEKASAAHSVKFFTGKSGLEPDEGREKNFGKATYSTDAGNANNAEHVVNHLFSNKPGVPLEKERVEDGDRKKETGGSETLRMKLWEVLGNVSSPNKDCPRSQPVEVHPDKERDGKHIPIGKRNPSSDTIESDSEKSNHTSKRPLTRSLTRKKASTKTQHIKSEAKKSTSHKNECPTKRIFSFRGDWSGRLYDNVNDGSLPSKRKKIEKESSRKETCQHHKYQNAEEIQQSENRSRSIPDVEKSMVHRNKVENPNSSNDRRNENAKERQQSENKSRSIPAVEKSMVHRNKVNNANSSNDKRNENVEERQQSENKSRSIPAVEKPMVHSYKVDNANSSNDRRSNVFVEPNISSKKNNLFQFPLNEMTEQPWDVESPKLKGQKEDIVNSLLKNKWSSVRDPPPSPTFEITSPGCLRRSNQGKLRVPSPAEKIFDTKGIRSFNSFWSSKSAELKPNAQAKSSDGRRELNDSPLVKPSFIVEEDSENRSSKSSTDAMDSESSEDDSHAKGCRETEPLSPEIYICNKILRGSNKSLGNKKHVEVTRCSPMSEPLKGIEDSGELQMYSEQNHEDGLASAVALITAALDRIKTKLKSMSSKRSAEILRAAAEEIFLQLQNAESQIKIDVGKLSNLSQTKRKRLETKFQEQQDQLLGIYKRFKEAVDQHLQDYGSVIEDLEEHEIELKRTVEKRRAAHKMFLSQVEQEIKVQLDDAESRIMAVQESAREKMLQLKLVVAECVKHGAFG